MPHHTDCANTDASPRSFARTLASKKEGHTMHKTIKSALVPALMLSAVLSLAGCSGGGTTPPATNTAPVANFTFTPAGGPAPLTVTTTNTSSDADAGDTLSYVWNWGDSSANDTTTAPTHTYSTAGTFTITLTTTDNHAASSTKTGTVTVTTAAPAAPTIVSVTPANGSVGNLIGQPIVITFSTPMNAAVTQGAYVSPVVPGSTALATNPSSFSWSAGNTVLTITPTTATAYALAPAAPIKYNYALTTAAISAAGLPLANQFDGSYSTAVKYTANINSDPAKDLVATDLSVSNPVLTTGTATMAIGDNAANKQLAAYLTFDLGGLSLPAALTSDRIVKATLKLVPNVNTGTPYAVTPAGLSTAGEKLGLYSLVYSTLPFTGTPATLNPATKLASNLDSSVLATFSPSVLSAVQADWTARVAQGNLSQYQLRFPVSTNANGSIDQATIWSSTAAPVTKPKLTVEYLQDN